MFSDCQIKDSQKDVKFEGEDEMLRVYKAHLKLKDKFEQLIRKENWKGLLDEAEGEQELMVRDQGEGGRLEPETRGEV